MLSISVHLQKGRKASEEDRGGEEVSDGETIVNRVQSDKRGSFLPFFFLRYLYFY